MGRRQFCCYGIGYDIASYHYKFNTKCYQGYDRQMRAKRVYSRNGFSVYEQTWRGTTYNLTNTEKNGMIIDYKVYYYQQVVGIYRNLDVCKKVVSNMIKLLKSKEK